MPLTEDVENFLMVIQRAVDGNQDAITTVNCMLDNEKRGAATRAWIFAVSSAVEDEPDLVKKRKIAELCGGYALYLFANSCTVMGSDEWKSLMAKSASSEVWAQNRLGLYYWKRGDFELAWPLLEQAVEGKCSEPALAIAWSYMEGYGKEVSYTKALEWFAKSDEENDPIGSWFVLGEEFNPIDGETKKWKDADLLINILVRVGPEREQEILDLLPGWDELITRPSSRRWITREEADELEIMPPSTLGSLKQMLG